MKIVRLVTILILMANLAVGQEVKKLKIGELEDYINKSEKPLVVNFWATFCIPCIEEIPYFQSIIKESYKDQVELLLVSLDLPDYYPAKVNSFVKARKFTAPVVWLNESNADIFCPRIDPSWSGSIPATLFVNNKTRYRHFHEGQLDRAAYRKQLKALTTSR